MTLSSSFPSRRKRGGPALKLLDRWIGIPLVWLAGLWVQASNRVRSRRHAREHLIDRLREDTPPIHFILLKTAAIGDTVLLSAAIRDIRRLYPCGLITVACGPSNFAAAKLIVAVDEVICLPMLSPLAIGRRLGRLRADVFIDFDSWPRINALIAFLSRSCLTIGFRTHRQFRHYAFHEVIDHDAAIHEVENYRNLVRRVGSLAGKAIDGPAEPSIRMPDHLRLTDSADLKRPYAVLHMFSGGSQACFKEWAPVKWRQIVTHLSSLGLNSNLCGGPEDRDRNLAFACQVPPLSNLGCLQPGNLSDLLPILHAASVVISVDTGIAHLAAALGAPTVVLYGPTSPTRWGVLGRSTHHVKDGQTPWISLGFERSAGGRPVALDVDEVVSVLTVALRCAGFPQQSATGEIDVHAPPER